MMRIIPILMGLVLGQQVVAQGTSETSETSEQAAKGRTAAATAGADATAGEAAARAEAERELGGDLGEVPLAEPVKETLAAPAATEPVPTNHSRWQPPEPEQAKVVNERDKAQGPARVRVGLRITPFKKIVTRGRDGTQEVRFVPGEALRHTLRARLNKTNHFFIGDWHVETVPTRWIKKSRRYEVRLNLYRRYGAFGQLEENVGSVDVAGTLDEQDDNVHVLLGVGRKRLRDKFGNPYADVVAGFSSATAQVNGAGAAGGAVAPGRF